MSEKYIYNAFNDNNFDAEVSPLRDAVSGLVSESYRNQIDPNEAGRWIREFVGLFIDDYESQLPEVIQLRPGWELRLDSCSLARNGVQDIPNQKELYSEWVSNSGLVVSGLRNNLR